MIQLILSAGVQLLVMLSGRGFGAEFIRRTLRSVTFVYIVTQTSFSERLLSARASVFLMANALFYKHNIAGHNKMVMKDVHECLLYMLSAEEQELRCRRLGPDSCKLNRLQLRPK